MILSTYQHLYLGVCYHFSCLCVQSRAWSCEPHPPTTVWTSTISPENSSSQPKDSLRELLDTWYRRFICLTFISTSHGSGKEEYGKVWVFRPLDIWVSVTKTTYLQSKTSHCVVFRSNKTKSLFKTIFVGAKNSLTSRTSL